MTEEETIFDDELNDDFLPTASNEGGEGELYEHFRVIVDKGQEPVRIDKFLFERMQHSSRNRIQKAADAGYIHVNNAPVKSNYKVRPEDVITLMLDRPKHDNTIEAEDIPLDVVYEDDVLMVVNKPAGLVVHPGAGNFHGTLINAIAWYLKDMPSFDPNDPEVGLVHRIDKDTSGLLVVAKNDKAHVKLSEMIANKDVKRKYYALVHGSIKHDYGTIDAPIARNPKERKEMAIIDEGKPSITHFKVVERFEKYTLIECELETGRTHQIRVHMKYINHPLVGDPVYGPRKTLNANGQALHSKSIEFNHPITGEHLYFETPIPQYMIDIMEKLDK